MSQITTPITLVICEKPMAARRIAQALGSKSFRKTGAEGEVPFFDVISDANEHFIVCSSVGHLYGLVDVIGNRNIYPVFDLEWAPVLSKAKDLSKSKIVIKNITDISQKATKFVNACDYDEEGEVIGFNILEYACKSKYEKSLRAKFSTLTDEEIRQSFNDLLKPSKGLAEAGRSRHMLDFIYGVNLSRALTQSFKANNKGKLSPNLSIGRVQGPTLTFVVDREIEIKKHVPIPYWIIMIDYKKDGYLIQAHYEKVETRLSQANSVFNACIGNDGIVSDIKDQKIILSPPTPFDIGDLQKEAHRLFKISPSYTLSIAEKLYLDALISYPRTASQKLPSSIDYKKVISCLSKVSSNYGSLTAILLSKKDLSPHEGTRTDPAHPAIYPTGEMPRRKLDLVEFKIFDLIVRRFLATFGDPALAQRIKVSIVVNNDHIFKAEYKAKTYEGWTYFYKPYFRLGQAQLPQLQVGDILKNINTTINEKFTEPPLRFNQSSLLEKMEKERIGTKATRADIINTLFKRNYVTTILKHDGIEATELGFAVIELMRKYIPHIVSIELTRSMEEQLEKIESKECDSLPLIECAVNKLINSLVLFKEKEATIGQQLIHSVDITMTKEMVVGICPVCHGGKLRIIKSRTTKKRFVGCSNYPANGCKATAPLPQKGSIKITGKICTICEWPIISVIFARNSKYVWKICVNAQCPSKIR